MVRALNVARHETKGGEMDLLGRTVVVETTHNHRFDEFVGRVKAISRNHFIIVEDEDVGLVTLEYLGRETAIKRISNPNWDILYDNSANVPLYLGAGGLDPKRQHELRLRSFGLADTEDLEKLERLRRDRQ